MTPERPVLEVSDADLEELRSRLRGTRWPRPWPERDAGGGWDAGTDAGELRRLVRYWAQGYGWRAQEAAINALPGQVASLDGTDVFYLRYDAESADYDPATITPGEKDYLREAAAWFAEEGGYEHEQMTRPQTLSYGLSDSPAGLLAWLVEKYRAWSDCGGDLSKRFSDDFVLTQASLYWFANAISTSFRPYYEYAQGMRSRVRKVTVPTAVAIFPKTSATRHAAGPSAATTSLATPPCPAADISPLTRSRICSPPTSPTSSARSGEARGTTPPTISS